VWLIHWGIELSAGLILLGAIFGLFLLVQRTPIAAQLVQWWFTAKTPILLFLQMMIVAGVVLLTAGPQPSRASAWTLLAVIAIGAGLFGAIRLATYLLDGPDALVQMTEWLPILYGLFYAAWAHRFCRWLASSGADDAPAQQAIRGGLTWKRLAGSMNIVFWILAIGGLLVSAPILGGFLMGLMLPFLGGGEDAMSMLLPLMAAAALLVVIGLPLLVLALLWVANRTYWINRRLKATIAEPVIGPIAALPPERIGSIGLALGAIAAVGLTLGLWADQVLAPAYQARQLEATLAQLGGGDRAAETLDLPAPEITLTPLSGPPVTLADFRGRVVMLNFYATWCPPALPRFRRSPASPGSMARRSSSSSASATRTQRRSVAMRRRATSPTGSSPAAAGPRRSTRSVRCRRRFWSTGRESSAAGSSAPGRTTPSRGSSTR